MLAPYTISHGSYRQTLYFGRERQNTKPHAYITRAGCEDTVAKSIVNSPLDDFSCNGIFANGHTQRA